MNKQFRFLIIGAHPDDADLSAGGTAEKLVKAGHVVKFLSVTNGNAGHYAMSGRELADRRTGEAAASGRILGCEYAVMDHDDGRLMPDLETREDLMREIRRFDPDVVITNRPNDYHADHRATAQLVQDCSFLLQVPNVCPDVPAMKDAPAVIFWPDTFQKPAPFSPDILSPVSEAGKDAVIEMTRCHRSQFFEWILWLHDPAWLSWSDAEKDARICTHVPRDLAYWRKLFDAAVKQTYGDQAKDIVYLEAFEKSEYGSEISQELIDLIQSL